MNAEMPQRRPEAAGARMAPRDVGVWMPRVPVAFASTRTVAMMLLATGILCGGCDRAITQAGADGPAFGVEVSFDPTSGTIPFPNDLIGRAADRTLFLDEGERDPNNPRVALSTVDGFSPSTAITVPLGGEIARTSLADANVVRVFRAELDSQRQGRLLSLGDELQRGQDFDVVPGPSRTLKIVPLVPFGLQQGIVFAVTTTLQGADGAPARPSSVFRLAIAEDPLVDGNGKTTRPRLVDDASASRLEPLRELFSPIADALEQRGVARASLGVCATFSTRSARPTLQALVDTADEAEVRGEIARTALVHPAPLLSTASLNPADGPARFAGIADLYAASVTLPLYVDATRPLVSQFVTESGTAPTANDPAPAPQSTMAVPVLVSVPGETSGQERPANGWPFVVFQHGITGDRTQLIAVSEAYASAGFAVVAMDLPLHGLTSAPSHPFAALNDQLSATSPAGIYAQSPIFAAVAIQERTLLLDVVDNTSGAPGVDGREDPSGTHFLNLQSLATAQDTSRQAIADLAWLVRAVPAFDLDGDGAGDFDRARSSFLGHSLGAILGSTAVAVDDRFGVSVLVAGGGGIVGLLLGSDTFGGVVRSQLESAGVVEKTAAFDSFVYAAQTLFDGADPISLATPTLIGGRRIFVMEHVGGRDQPPDTVVPNAVPAFPLSGSGPWASRLAPTLVDTLGAQSPAGVRARWRIRGGDHSALLDPTRDIEVTTAMQRAAVTFAATAGTSTGEIEAALIAPALIAPAQTAPASNEGPTNEADTRQR